MVGSNLRGNSCGRQSSSFGTERSRRKQGGPERSRRKQGGPMRVRMMRVVRMETDGAMETW